MGDLYAFVDESGNEEMQLDKPEASALYVVVAMLLTEEQLPKAREAFYRAKASHLKQHREMKSSHLGDDDQKRTHLLTDLLMVPCQLHVIVVDKGKLTSEGFSYPASFAQIH